MNVRQAGGNGLLMWLLLLTVSTGARAQQRELSLTAALQQALEGNAELGVAQAQTDSARGQVRQSALRPNPRLTVQTEDIGTGTSTGPFSFVNSTEDYLLVGQTVEVAGKRRKRMDVASGNLSMSELQTGFTRRQIVTRVSTAYWSAVLADRVQRFAEETLHTYDEDVHYLEARVNEGVAPEADVVRVRVERDRLRITAMQARRDREQSLVALFRAMGKREFPGVALTTPLDRTEIPRMPSIEEVLAARPEVGIAQQAIAVANSNLKLQRALSKPDPQVFGGYKRNVGYDTAYAAVQVDLPILNRNQGNVGSAEAQVRREEENLRLTQNAVRADYEAALRYYRDQQDMVKALPTLVLQAQDGERRARAAYREGGIELLRLLDAERSRIQVEIDYARSLADLQQSMTMVRAASGADIAGAGK